MQFIDIAEKEWEVFKHRLLQKTNFTGIFVIRGLSEQVTSQLSILLEAAVRSDYYLYYFLCSGSKAFHIPCYMSASALQETSDIPTPYDVLENANLLRPQPPFFSPHQAVYNLNKEVINRQGISQLLVLECITAPTENDQLFILYLLRSILPKHIPVLIFVHQASVKKNFKCFQEKNTLNDILYTMYICGGRIAKSDFESLLQYVSLPYEQVERYFALRSAQEESWFSYRSNSLAKHIENQFHTLSKDRKQKLAKNILPLLPLQDNYPLLTIACYTDDVQLMLSHYSLKIIKSLLYSSRQDLLIYFRKLRGLTKKEGPSSLFFCSTVNYIATLLLENTINPIRIYKILCTNYFQDEATLGIRQALFFAMGQILSKEKDPDSLIYAAECYDRRRMIIQEMQYIDQTTRQAMLAANENGEALVAIKQNDWERAFQLESTALHRLSNFVSDPQQKIMLQTHISDLLFHSFHQLDAAITQYEEAYSLALTYSSLETKLYVVPKLLRAYMKTQEYTKAVAVLENLLADWKQHPEYKIETRATTNLQILLPLAQAYMATKQLYNAALCYLHILLEPEQISPAVLKGIALNLKHCLPDEPESFWMWVEHIIYEQERCFTEAATLRTLLISL